MNQVDLKKTPLCPIFCVDKCHIKFLDFSPLCNFARARARTCTAGKIVMQKPEKYIAVCTTLPKNEKYSVVQRHMLKMVSKQGNGCTNAN